MFPWEHLSILNEIKEEILLYLSHRLQQASQQQTLWLNSLGQQEVNWSLWFNLDILLKWDSYQQWMLPVREEKNMQISIFWFFWPWTYIIHFRFATRHGSIHCLINALTHVWTGFQFSYLTWYTSQVYQLNHFPAYILFSMGQGSLLCTLSHASKTIRHKVAHMEGI